MRECAVPLIFGCLSSVSWTDTLLVHRDLSLPQLGPSERKPPTTIGRHILLVFGRGARAYRRDAVVVNAGCYIHQ